VNYRIAGAYLLLLAIGVPWYWPPGITGMWFGFPVWVAVALLVSLLASILTAWLLLRGGADGESDPP